jgi:hypothetical protein
MLTESAIRAKPKDKRYKLDEERSQCLAVTPTGSKQFSLFVMVRTHKSSYSSKGIA